MTISIMQFKIFVIMYMIIISTVVSHVIVTLDNTGISINKT